jgi:4-hydroxybenzoate polyprenyltransferase
MVTMKSFIKLVRWQNLLIVALTMIMMRYCIIEPVISRISILPVSGGDRMIPLTLQFPWYDFIILVAATVMITAGGYVINDYFDIRTDLINRGEVIVGTKIPRRQAMMWHNILNIGGVAAGFYVSWKAGYFWLGIMFLVVSGLLYFYSASYKRQFLIGNLVVSFLTAMVPLLVAIYEWPYLYRYCQLNAVSPPDLSLLFYWVGGFSVFAFLTNLAREIVKDIEDFEGDNAYGRNTLPVVTGILTSRIISACLVLLIIISLYLVWYFFINDLITLLYITVAIALPLVYVIFRLLSSRRREQFHSASRMIKIVMLTGILYSVVVMIIIKGNLI